MNTYNLGALHDKEFEALAVDLLGEEIGVRIERFKPGKDGGVDGRWFATGKREIIVQCKHWLRSGIRALSKHMAVKERPKLLSLCPPRYILITSVELSRRNKQSLAKSLLPYVLAESDIYGSEDIHDLLARHPEVEKRHYKLWLTSSSALSHIFNSAIIGRSHFDETKIRAKMPLLVQTDDFTKAKELLSRRHVVVITGAPGIGKTTLAEQLIIDSLASGFELISIEQDVSEAESIYSRTRNQIFYFDDFLGRNLLEALELKYDSHIVGFINRIRHDKTKRFVLTSRSNILNQAKHLTDLFDIEKLSKSEYEVKVEHLSRMDKARILYGHIWHSDLPGDTLDELFKDKRYKFVADHKNFNPRLVSFITDNDRADVRSPECYWKYVTDALSNPQDIWGHFFAAQLNDDCRDFVYLVVLNGKPIGESILTRAFRDVHSGNGKEGEIEHRAFVAAKICTGSVLNRRVNASTGRAEYELYNPSIADYVFRAVMEWRVFQRYIAALRTTTSLNTLRYMRSSGVLSSKSQIEILSYLAEKEAERAASAVDAYSLELCNRLIDEEECAMRHMPLIRTVAETIVFDDFTGSELAMIYVIGFCAERESISDAFGRALELLSFLESWPFSYQEFNLLSDLVEKFSGREKSRLEDVATRCVKRYWHENISDFVEMEDLLKDVYVESDFPAAIDEVSSSITRALRDSGFVLSEDETREICGRLDLNSIAERNRESSYNDEAVSGPSPLEKDVEDQMIDDLFERDGT